MLEFKFDKNYYGEGISRGIPRGLLPYLDGRLIVQEGMGIGSFAVQYGNRTYFCSIEKIDEYVISDSHKEIDVEYSVDMMLEWTFIKRSSPLLTSFLENVASKCYMKSEAFQDPLLKIGTLIRRLLGIKPDFKKIESLGNISASYAVGESDIKIVADCNLRLENYKLFVMNEIGGELFSRSVICGQEKAPPTGWQRIEKSDVSKDRLHVLKSPSLGLAFHMDEIFVPPYVESTLFWGREVSDGYNWAGFESELKCSSSGFEGYAYRIWFENAAQEVWEDE